MTPEDRDLMKRKTLYVALVLVVAVAIGAGFLWRSRQQAAESADALRSAVVEQGSMLVTVSASGSIELARRADLALETSGQVAEVAVAVGDEVQEGDLLVSLDVERLELQVDQAEANLASAQAQLAKVQAGASPKEIEATEASLRSTEAQVDAAEAERNQVSEGAGQADIAAVEAEVAAALTQQMKAYDWHETTLECVDIKKRAGDVINIGGGQVITLTEGFEKTICPLLGVPEEQARYRLEAADEALEAARARLEEAKAGADPNQLSAARANVAAAAAQREATQAQLDLMLEGATQEQVAAAQASVDQAEVSVREAELSLDQATLEAPFDGVIAAVNVTVGERASAGLPIMTLVDPSRFHATIAVDELDVEQLAPGQTARLTFDAIPDTVVTGTVKHIAEAATLDGGIVTYDVWIDLAPTDAPIRSDMTTSATIVVDEIADALKIPTWAVYVDRDSAQYYVHRRTAEGIERVNVSLGDRYEGLTQVLQGLSAGLSLIHI